MEEPSEFASRLRGEARRLGKLPGYVGENEVARPLSALLEAAALSTLSVGICYLHPDPVPVRATLSKDGLRWECTDSKPHRSKVVAVLEP